MLPRLPRSVPPAAVLLADLGDPTAASLADSLGVSVRTVWRWRERDEWPRAALLALYFASRWGWSEVASDARWQVATHRALADARQLEIERLTAEVRRLAALACYGSANEPTMLGKA